MKNKLSIRAELEILDSVDELNDSERALVQAAREMTKTAYAPYSRFHVGAALELEDGTVVTGNNQENASYTLGLCAERVALFAAGSHHPGKKIKAIAISAYSGEFNIDRPIAPCGACRQVIAEYEHLHKHPIRLILSGNSGQVWIADSIKDLLPLQFTSDDLKS